MFSAAAPAETKAHPPVFPLILILGGLVAFGPLSIDMYLPAFPTIAASLHTSEAEVQLSLASFFIGLSIGQLVYGPVSDRVGRIAPLKFGLILYCIGSIACALAPTVEILILARILQALGGCAGMVIARAIVRDCYAPQDSARMFSLLMLVMGLAPILAPLIGGVVSAHLGWRALFWVLAIVSALMWFVVSRWLKETREPDPEASLKQSLARYKGLVFRRSFVSYALAGGFAQAGMFAYIAGSPFVFITLFGVPAERFGWVFGSNALGLISASQINVFLLRRYGSDQILNLAMALLFIFGIALIGVGVAGGGIWVLTPILFFFIATLGVTFPNATAGALAREGRNAATAGALLGSIQFVMASLAANTVSALHDGTSFPMTVVVGTCGVLSLMSLLLLREKSASVNR